MEPTSTGDWDNAGIADLGAVSRSSRTAQRLALWPSEREKGSTGISEPAFVLASQKGHWRPAAAINFSPTITNRLSVQDLTFRQRSVRPLR